MRTVDWFQLGKAQLGAELAPAIVQKWTETGINPILDKA
jgi:hypothetical protein